MSIISGFQSAPARAGRENEVSRELYDIASEFQSAPARAGRENPYCQTPLSPCRGFNPLPPGQGGRTLGPPCSSGVWVVSIRSRPGRAGEHPAMPQRSISNRFQSAPARAGRENSSRATLWCARLLQVASANRFGSAANDGIWSILGRIFSPVYALLGVSRTSHAFRQHSKFALKPIAGPQNL